MALDKKVQENRQLQAEISRLQFELDTAHEATQTQETQVKELQQNLQKQKDWKPTEQATVVIKEEKEDNVGLKEELKQSKQIIERLNQQIAEFGTDAAKKHSGLQVQLQSMEQLLQQMRLHYEEFVQITRLEHGALRDRLEQENAELRESFTQHKREQLEEHKAMINDHQSVLQTMQALFDEYRKTSSFLLNIEVSKLEDELMNQSLRYEHEITFIVHSKDKFYADMMVNKDAKIMSLIEGSDLTALLEKHEAELEAMRRECTLELQRFKTQQENEQTRIIALLQRQNSVLETKTEKLTTHIKNLDTRLRDLTAILEQKTKIILQKEEEHVNLVGLHHKEITQEKERYSMVFQEKENLRHKIIRMKMESRGAGKFSVQHMISKLNKESCDIAKQHADLLDQHEKMNIQMKKLDVKNRESRRIIENLNSEVKKRTNEYNSVVSVFESLIIAKKKPMEVTEKKIQNAQNLLRRFKALSRAFLRGNQMVGTDYEDLFGKTQEENNEPKIFGATRKFCPVTKVQMYTPSQTVELQKLLSMPVLKAMPNSVYSIRSGRKDDRKKIAECKSLRIEAPSADQ